MIHRPISQLFFSRHFLRALPVIAIGLVTLCAAIPAAAKPPPKKGKEVKIINDASKPVPTYDVDATTREPFQDETQINLNITGFLSSPIYTVPSGKRAVIETVTLIVQSPVSEDIGGFTSVQTTLNGSSANHFLVLNEQGTLLSSEIRTANHSVRVYADGDTQIRLNGLLQVNSTIFVSLSGYLEPMP